MRPQDYVHIQAWGSMLSSFPYYVRQQQEKACKDHAPPDATYFSTTDGRWHTVADIIDPITRERIDELVDQINHNREN